MVAKKKTAAAAAKPPTKSEIFAKISTDTGLTKKQVGEVFDSLNMIIKRNVGRRGPGVFTLPGLMKIKVVKKPATKARKGINPFTGEEMMFKAKPARKTAKILALKGLKDML
ncbi:MAG: HU family DNA-binding protein [Chromatiales bacterium]|jgi:nucleoid DNA-binding protein|nr:HU family DNA-binding protein [Chromatiales bacterium]MDH3931769.1 HU family DNA-binding protein [Chromatiales bacterium]MDH3945950.1 HU family DNA-binding protein [Chromatiales bacterium]MDH4013176.1 HU family DNA-binding protein [Chromatiales bacterium]PLX56060.1 MAG: DNA-binding protein [Chromatiales bacterium]